MPSYERMGGGQPPIREEQGLFGPYTRLAKILGLLFVGLLLFLSTFYTVGSNEKTVLTRFGAFQSVEGEGLHFKIPFVHSITTYRIDIQKQTAKAPANTYTIDNQEIDVTPTVLYRVPAANVEFIFRNAQDFLPQLETMMVDRLKAEMGKVNAAHVAERRTEVRNKIRDILANDAKILGVEIVDFQLSNLDYTKSFRQAVEQAAAAKAGVETKSNELEQERKAAETVRVRAQGAADAVVFAAEAEAKKIKLSGEATADAIKAQTEALAQNVQLVELEKAKRWDGKLPATMLSNTVPFMHVDQAGVVNRAK